MLSQSALQVKTKDLRRHARVQLVLFGRCRLHGAGSFPCHTKDVSPGGVALYAPVAPQTGVLASVHLDRLGEFDGEIVRTFPGGFAMAFDLDELGRARLERRLLRLAGEIG